MDITFLSDTLVELLKGAPLTLELAATSVGLGFVLALALGLTLQSAPAALRWSIRGYVTLFRGTPLLVQIFLIYYGLGQFRPTLQALGIWGFFRQPYWCAILALTLNTAAYGAEIIRGGLQSVPHGQIEAARACGMPPWTAYRLVVLPIALRQALPSYGNEIILMIKGTSLTSIITLLEITGVAQQIISQTYRAVEVFACAGAIYLSMNYLVAQSLAALEHWLSPHLRTPNIEGAVAIEGGLH